MSMSTRARRLAALAVFAVCAILLIPLSFASAPAANPAAKPPAADKGAAAKAKPAPKPKTSQAKKFLPVRQFGDY
jgi:hypothetical protein